MFISTNQSRQPRSIRLRILLGSTLAWALVWMLLPVNPIMADDKAHLLGPTGLMGAVDANRITITKIDEGSPADGKLKVGDVIVGAGGNRFHADPRREIAEAINDAETFVAEGKLPLMLDDGHTVELKLIPLGTYSDTAPYQCPKTDRIVRLVADRMVKTGDYKKGALCVGWLGFMATDEAPYIDIVKRELPKEDWVHPNPEDIDAVVRGEKDMGLIDWSWGYRCITLAEYYLLTGDKSVLPGLETYSVALARGQDPAGLWAHRLATPRTDGRLPGYAQINQPSLTCYLGILLAKKCGIENPAFDKAIPKTHQFFASYIDKGALPYGVHKPYLHVFNNNGSSATAALAMSFLGDKEGAAFFSHQSATSYDDLEKGHATYYFNVLWTPLGANVAGPEVTQSFSKNARWLYTLYRTWDGRFTYDGGESGDGNSSGSLLLNLCIPRHALCITGKDADASLWLKGRQVTDVIDASRIDYEHLSDAQLLALFGHPAPQVRVKAIGALRERGHPTMPELVAMLDKGTRDQRISAISYFGNSCPPEVAQPRLTKLVSILRDENEDAEVRAAAAAALSYMGKPAYPCFTEMLRMVLADQPNDPLRLIDRSLADSLVNLCADPFAAGLVTDKDLFYKAVLKLADHSEQATRSNAMSLLTDMPLSDFYRVADKVEHVIKNRDPAYRSYHNPGNGPEQGVRVLANLHIKEGLAWAYDTLKTPDGKGSFKIFMVLRSLAMYGPHARTYLDELKARPDSERTFQSGKFKKWWDALVEAVDTPDTQPIELMTFEQAIKAGTPH
ncbi:MAG: hypothetical protein GC164_04000 [Phycisphaera sp.]|nr:hypothetical protein [Phycisphaera sp.]